MIKHEAFYAGYSWNTAAFSEKVKARSISPSLCSFAMQRRMFIPQHKQKNPLKYGFFSLSGVFFSVLKKYILQKTKLPQNVTLEDLSISAVVAFLGYQLWPCCPTQWSALNPQVAPTKLSLQQEHQAFLKSSHCPLTPGSMPKGMMRNPACAVTECKIRDTELNTSTMQKGARQILQRRLASTTQSPPHPVKGVLQGPPDPVKSSSKSWRAAREGFC